MEVTIAGKKVVFRSQILVEDGWNYFDLMAKAVMTDLRTYFPLAKMAIESWEFDGDPHDDAAYLKLDVLREALPLFRAVMVHLQQRLGESSENDEAKN